MSFLWGIPLMFNSAVTDIFLKAENFTALGYKLGPNYEFLVLPVTGFQKNYLCSGYLPFQVRFLPTKFLWYNHDFFCFSNWWNLKIFERWNLYHLLLQFTIFQTFSVPSCSTTAFDVSSKDSTILCNLNLATLGISPEISLVVPKHPCHMLCYDLAGAFQ